MADKLLQQASNNISSRTFHIYQHAIKDKKYITRKIKV